MSEYKEILVDEPRAGIRRITLNQPKKRNCLSPTMRGEYLGALQDADEDPSIRVMILCGAGKCFSSGYDLSVDITDPANLPFRSSHGEGMWPRHVTEGAFKIWDLGKPVLAQVHGYCLAGGSELAAACDLVYVSEDAKIGYPPVRLISPPDNQFFPWIAGMRSAMEMMLTGDAVDGPTAVRIGLANRCFPNDELENGVLDIAERIAKIPTDLQQLNKRSVHRAMEIMGMRAAIRAGTEIQALATTTESSRNYILELQKGVSQALTKRDEKFGDYRTAKS